MKKIILVAVLLIIAGYFVNSYLKEKAKQEVESAEAKRIEQTIKSSVAETVSRTNADDGWERRLSKGERHRVEPVFSVELEKLWLVNRPILFIGAIKDITTQNESHYTVLVERSLFGDFKYMFDTELQLSLSSPKQQIDAFLKQHPKLLKGYGFNNGVAVIARVNAIRTTYVSGENGARNEVKIGDGELIDIVYTGGTFF